VSLSSQTKYIYICNELDIEKVKLLLNLTGKPAKTDITAALEAAITVLLAI
jgi:hypothetical protein